MNLVEAVELLKNRLAKFKTNAEFLMSLIKTRLMTFGGEADLSLYSRVEWIQWSPGVAMTAGTFF